MSSSIKPQVVEHEKNTDVVQFHSQLGEISRAEIDSSIATAKQYPRDPHECMQRALNIATMTPEVAAEMSYALPRGKKTIEGPSIRLAEVVGQSWQNIRVGAVIAEVGEKHVTARSVAHDLENNFCVSKDVRRRITDKNDKRFNDDMINVTANAAISIAIRDALFRIIPKPMVDQIRVECRKVAVGDQVGLATRRAKAIEAFSHYGVDEPRLLEKLELQSVEQMTPDHIAQLQGYFVAIRDGEATIESMFPAQATASLTNKAKAKAKAKVKPGQTSPPAPPAPPITNAPVNDPLGLPDYMQDLKKSIDEAQTDDALAAIHSDWGNDPTIDPSHIKIMNQWVEERREKGF